MKQKRRRGFRRPGWLRVPKMPVIDTQSPEFEKWMTRIWVITVMGLFGVGCWFGWKAYVGYRQQQQSLPTQQATAPEATTTQPQQAEAQPSVQEIEIPEIEPGNMRSVIAYNQAVRVAESLQRGGPVNMRKQLAESSTSSSQEETSQNGGVNMREILKSQKGSESGDTLGVQPKDDGKKSPWEIFKEVAAIVGVLLLILGLFYFCMHEATQEWARPAAVFVSGFVGGYLFFIHCIWTSFKPGMVVGLIVGLAFIWIYCGWSQPPESRSRGGENFINGVKGRWSWLGQRWRERRNHGQGGGQPPTQPPLVTGGDQGGDS